MDESSRQTEELEQDDLGISELFLSETLPDAIREAEMDRGIGREALSEQAAGENADYLTAVAAMGNQSMLLVLRYRMAGTQDDKGGDPGEFTAIMDLVDKTVNGYNERVDRTNFPTKYGDMMLNYAALMKACSDYLAARAGKRHVTARAREREAGRRKWAEQIVMIAEREMRTAQQFSEAMAESAAGVSWWELFTAQARNAAVKLHRQQVDDEKLTAAVNAALERLRRQYALAGKELTQTRIDMEVAVEKLKFEYATAGKVMPAEEIERVRAQFLPQSEQRETGAEQETQEGAAEQEQPAETAATSEAGQVAALTTELMALRARMDAPKLRVMTQSERTAWQKGTFTEPPAVMDGARFLTLLAKPAFQSEDMDGALVEKIQGWLTRLNHIDPARGTAEPPSKRVARRFLEELQDYRDGYELIELLARQCEAVLRYEPPAEAGESAPEQEVQEIAPEQGEQTPEPNPFLTEQQTLNSSMAQLHHLLSAETRGRRDVDRMLVRQIYELFRTYGTAAGENVEIARGIIERRLIELIPEQTEIKAFRQIRQAAEAVQRERRYREYPEERPKEPKPDYTEEIQADTDALLDAEKLVRWCTAVVDDSFTDETLGDMAAGLRRLNAIRSSGSWDRQEMEALADQLIEQTTTHQSVSPAMEKLRAQCQTLKTQLEDEESYPQAVRRRAEEERAREEQITRDRALAISLKLMPVAQLRAALADAMERRQVPPKQVNEIGDALWQLRELLDKEEPTAAAAAAAAVRVARLCDGYEALPPMYQLMNQCADLAAELDPEGEAVKAVNVRMERVRRRVNGDRQEPIPITLFDEAEGEAASALEQAPDTTTAPTQAGMGDSASPEEILSGGDQRGTPARWRFGRLHVPTTAQLRTLAPSAPTEDISRFVAAFTQFGEQQEMALEAARRAREFRARIIQQPANEVQRRNNQSLEQSARLQLRLVSQYKNLAYSYLIKAMTDTERDQRESLKGVFRLCRRFANAVYTREQQARWLENLRRQQGRRQTNAQPPEESGPPTLGTDAPTPAPELVPEAPPIAVSMPELDGTLAPDAPTGGGMDSDVDPETGEAPHAPKRDESGLYRGEDFTTLARRTSATLDDMALLELETAVELLHEKLEGGSLAEQEDAAADVFLAMKKHSLERVPELTDMYVACMRLAGETGMRRMVEETEADEALRGL